MMNKLFEKLYILFLIISLTPLYAVHFIDLFGRYCYWNLLIHTTIIYCLWKQKQETWWILCFLTIGLVLGNWSNNDTIAYARDTSFFLLNWLGNYWGAETNKHLNLIFLITQYYNLMQCILLFWLTLRSTKLKYQVASDSLRVSFFSRNLDSNIESYFDMKIISFFVPIVGIFLCVKNSKFNLLKTQQLIYASLLGCVFCIGIYYLKVLYFKIIGI
jgi:hypothetical protein